MPEQNNKNNRGQTIFLSIIGVATLLVAIVGATFAWFSVSIVGNEDASSITVTTATLGTVTFTDGTEINEPSWYPGDTTSKTFTIAADANASVNTGYNIALNVTTNTLNDPAFMYSLSGSGNTNGGTLVSATDVQVPTTNATIGSAGVLAPGETHTYTFTIKLEEANSDQNYLQGKTFSAKLAVSSAGDRFTAGGSAYTP